MKRVCCRHPRASRGIAALVEILIVAVLILGGALLYLGMIGGSSSNETNRLLNEGESPTAAVGNQPHSIPGRAIRKAEGLQCQENLRQIRMMIDADSQEGSRPPSLASIQETARIRTCPVGHVDYQYDPGTGRVWCPFPGHESY